MTKIKSQFGVCVFSLVAGSAFLGGLFASVDWTGGLPLCTPFMAVKLAVAAAVGLLLRGLRRKIFFGGKLTLHQSLSFEALIQCARRLNPWGTGKAFEAEFIKREANLESDADDWARSDSTGTPFAALLALFLFLMLVDMKGSALIVLAFCVLPVYAARRKLRPSAICAVIAGAVLAVEGLLFAWAVNEFCGCLDALVVYVLFTMILRHSPVPAGVGVAELSALAFSGAMAPMLMAVTIFHAFRLLYLIPLGYFYLARYKFAFMDFFRGEIVAALHASRRPVGGWPLEKDSPAFKKGAPLVSVVIPAYNEEARLPSFLDSVRAYLSRPGAPSMEVVVVDDGSKDGTAALVEKMSKIEPRVRLVRQIPNQGKGAAVRRGVLESHGRFVLFADADGATPINEMEHFIPAMARGEGEVLIGSRKAASADVERERKGLRALMGMVFYGIVNYLAVPGVKDTQCGFKMFRGDVARRLFANCQEKGWAFDVELLYLAQLYGYKIVEIPVNWHEVEGSKVNPIKDSLKMLSAIFRIRRRHEGFLH